MYITLECLQSYHLTYFHITFCLAGLLGLANSNCHLFSDRFKKLQCGKMGFWSWKREGNLQLPHTPQWAFLPLCVGLFKYIRRPPACALAHSTILLYNPIPLKSPSSTGTAISFSSLIMSSVMMPGFNSFLCGRCGLKCSVLWYK